MPPIGTLAGRFVDQFAAILSIDLSATGERGIGQQERAIMATASPGVSTGWMIAGFARPPRNLRHTRSHCSASLSHPAAARARHAAH